MNKKPGATPLARMKLTSQFDHNKWAAVRTAYLASLAHMSTHKEADLGQIFDSFEKDEQNVILHYGDAIM